MSAGHDAVARDGAPSRIGRGTAAGRAAPTAAEDRRGDWTARLLAVTQALNGAGGPTVALGEAFGRVAAALGATSAMVAVLDGAWLAFRPDLYSLRALDPTWPSRVRLADPTSFSAVAAVSGR